MLNKPTIIAKFFNLPERTARNWAKEEVDYLQGKEAWRFKLLEKLDAYMNLEKKAHQKILQTFIEEELTELAGCILRNDYFPLLEVQAELDLQELLKQIIIYECENEKIQKALLLKAQELCDFEIYSLFDLLEKADIKAHLQAETEGKLQADLNTILHNFTSYF